MLSQNRAWRCLRCLVSALLQDDRWVYMMFEPCLGGEFLRLLRRKVRVRVALVLAPRDLSFLLPRALMCSVACAKY